jgi:hypothetical protein
MFKTLTMRILVAVVTLLGSATIADAQRRRALPPLTPEEAELAMRYSVERQLRSRVSVPDSATMQRLISLAVRYRDSSRVIVERERVIRSELSREGYPRPPRALNETRIACLMGELTTVERQLFNLRIAERTEVATFLAPVSRLQYMNSQATIHRAVDENRDYTRDRRTQLVRSGVLPPQAEIVGPGGQTRAQLAASICPG